MNVEGARARGSLLKWTLMATSIAALCMPLSGCVAAAAAGIVGVTAAAVGYHEKKVDDAGGAESPSADRAQGEPRVTRVEYTDEGIHQSASRPAMGAGSQAVTSISGKKAAIEFKWQTTSEVNVLGFNLMRSTSPDGPWTQVNSELIPSLGSTVDQHSYAYTDSGVSGGQKYYYFLEEVLTNGERRKLSDVMERQVAS